MKKQRIAAALMASVMAFSTISSNVFADDIVSPEAVSLEEAVLSESALAAEEADTAEDKTAEEENEVRVFADGFSDGVNGKAVLLRLLPALAGAQAEDHAAAGITQIQRMGVALGAVADDGDRLAVQIVEVAVLLVVHLCHDNQSPLFIINPLF